MENCDLEVQGCVTQAAARAERQAAMALVEKIARLASRHVRATRAATARNLVGSCLIGRSLHTSPASARLSAVNAPLVQGNNFVTRRIDDVVDAATGATRRLRNRDPRDVFGVGLLGIGIRSPEIASGEDAWKSICGCLAHRSRSLENGLRKAQKTLGSKATRTLWQLVELNSQYRYGSSHSTN